ncbi:antimicrobial peptide, SdpC family [Fictibacillus solisalsi]|uniref:Antimicrobial peptide, SdpC family n=1 Tax=Fictibacillus solisalsi TaxID=459525 RepID=A0A1H0A2L6_9BACL|nr:sporulation delaying protein family toxin [Fictibacillus solisalsi]SDN27627.1 antimicrobial peptide, SdpC family [Fictibacillus solisalsi]
MKKIVLSLLTLALVFGVAFSQGSGKTVQAQNLKYSGEELFKGFVFAQGDLGQKMDEVFNKSTVEKLNSKESKKFANKIMKEIKKEDPSYFNKLQKAVYSKNPAKVDKLLKDGGKIIEADITEQQKKMAKSDGVVGAAATVSVEWYYYYYYAAAAAAGIILVLFAIDITPIAKKDDTNREMAIRSLLEEVN